MRPSRAPLPYRLAFLDGDLQHRSAKFGPYRRLLGGAQLPGNQWTGNDAVTLDRENIFTTDLDGRRGRSGSGLLRLRVAAAHACDEQQPTRQANESASTLH